MNSPWPQALTIFGVLIAFWLWADWHIKRKLAKLPKRRPEPTQSEFVALLAEDCDPETANWLWDKIVFYTKPTAPHPDDLIGDDLCIDEDDCVDWFNEFLSLNNLNVDEWPIEWPIGTALTVRNFARYLTKKPPVEAMNN